MKLFIFAESQESEKLLKHLEIIENIKLPFKNNYQSLLKCNYNGKSFLVGHSGVGKSNAAQFLSYVISQYKIDHIINCGPAAYLNKKDIGTPIHIIKSHYYDVDLTALPNYTIGKLPDLDLYFGCDKNLIHKLNYEIAACASADKFASENDGKLIAQNFELTKVIDMECASYNQVANNYGILFNSVKVVSDCLDNSNNLEYRESKKIWEESIVNVILKILKEIL